MNHNSDLGASYLLYSYRPPTMRSDGYAIFTDQDGIYLEIRWHRHLGLLSLRRGDKVVWKQGEAIVIGQPPIVIADEDGEHYAAAVADPGGTWARAHAHRA